MNLELSQEQKIIVETTRNFVENELYPLEADVEKNARVPKEIAEEIKRKVINIGFFAANMPQNLGGGGLDHLSFTLMERELGRASMALTVFWGRPSNILLECNPQQKEKYLLPAIKGEKFDALAMTEPNAGSDLKAMQCLAKKINQKWILNGTKHFISHADIADFAITFVKSGDDTITCFLVDRDTPGFTIRKGYNSVSHKGYHNAILEFDNCELDDNNILGKPHQGFDIAKKWLYATRLTVAAQCVGRARRVFDYAVDYAVQRKQFGKQISKFQGVSFKIADMITQIDAADWLTLAAAEKLDQGKNAEREIASAKLFASEMLAEITDQTLQIYGGMGLMDDLPIERFWRDARIERIWDGTSEIQRHIISREVLRPKGG